MAFSRSNSFLGILGSALVLSSVTIPSLAAEDAKPAPKKIEYVRFLDLLPKALVLDKGIENESINGNLQREFRESNK